MSLLVAMLLSATSGWPSDLTEGWTAVTVSRFAPGEPARTTRLALGSDGEWKVISPWKGDADVLAINRLKLALTAPQQVPTAVTPGPVALEIELRQGKRVRKVRTHVAGLNAPVPVTVDGKPFAIAPVELAIKLPDPDDFAPPGLWVAAKDEATSVEVKGPVSYTLVGKGEEWKALDAREQTHDLDDVVGVIVGRQAVGHPSGADLEALGLKTPIATARLCIEKRCREFKFGTANGRCYAMAPDSDPLELRDNDWKLLVEGPFKAR